MVKIVRRFCCKWDFWFLFLSKVFLVFLISILLAQVHKVFFCVRMYRCTVTFYLYEIWWWFFDRVDRRIGIASHTGPRMISWLFSFQPKKARVFFEHQNLFLPVKSWFIKGFPNPKERPLCWFCPKQRMRCPNIPEKQNPQKSPLNSRTRDSTFKIPRVLVVVTGLGEDVLSIQPLGAIFPEFCDTTLWPKTPPGDEILRWV